MRMSASTPSFGHDLMARAGPLAASPLWGLEGCKADLRQETTILAIDLKLQARSSTPQPRLSTKTRSSDETDAHPSLCRCL